MACISRKSPPTPRQFCQFFPLSLHLAPRDLLGCSGALAVRGWGEPLQSMQVLPSTPT